MSTVEVEVFEAFKSVGITPEMAMKAAVALSESRGGELSRVEKKLDKLDEKVLVADTRLAKVETKLDVHTWLFGLILAVVLLVLGKVLTLHG